MELNKVYQMDCIEGLKLLSDSSIDFILMDPPYGINKEGVHNDHSLEIYYNVLPELYRVLKEDSFMVSFVSIGRLPEFFLNNPFTYRWQFIVYVDNGMVRGSVGFNRFMAAVIFQKGNAKMRHPMVDIVRISTSSQECAKRVHPTQKDEKICRKLIDAFSREGDVVLDPFMGGGTTAVVAKQRNRQFIGFELDGGYVEAANKRLAQKTLIETEVLG